MDGGCILMIISVLIGIGSIGAGITASRRGDSSAQAHFVVGVVFLVAPFAWVWWSIKRDEKRRK